MTETNTNDYIISPSETPFQALVGKGTADNTYTEWLTDALAPTNKDNGAIEGDLIVINAEVSDAARIGNYTQISAKTASVTGYLYGA